MLRPIIATAIAAACLTAAPAQAQMAEHADTGSFMQDISSDLQTVRRKVEGLAHAIPAEMWSWRPGEGVRSIGDVFMHITADNYYILAAAGGVPPEWTGIDPDDYRSTSVFEHRELTPEQIIEELSASFDHSDRVVASVDESKLDRRVSLFGQEFSEQGMWILQATHLHEHLGQMIAYARMNGVVPPWSR
jgi:uncharacterized damage-inducible protein DinB